MCELACLSLACPLAGVKDGALKDCGQLYVCGGSPASNPVTVTVSTRLGTGRMQTSLWVSQAPKHCQGPLPARPCQTSPAQPRNEPCILTRSDQPTEVTESPSTERSQSRVTWGKEGAVGVS